MESSNENIYPIFNQIISKREKENRLKQNAKCIWLTGLSGSGKTTLALRLERELFEKGRGLFSQEGFVFLDSDWTGLGFLDSHRTGLARAKCGLLDRICSL